MRSLSWGDGNDVISFVFSITLRCPYDLQRIGDGDELKLIIFVGVCLPTIHTSPEPCERGVNLENLTLYGV